eukprot:TRINITY_DN1153_c0_g1_i2.p3 TRINITY_DN1153_c0_g1~~TRINITY_DN1153_c0_g1_i2.p3  ORF type:complete len:792 (-),score=148.05 TRINITY_DN1153_c0_g1_i2:24109-26484(-)
MKPISKKPKGILKSKPVLNEITNTSSAKFQCEVFLEKMQLASNETVAEKPSHYSKLSNFLDEITVDSEIVPTPSEPTALKAKLSGLEIELKEAYNTISDLKKFLDQERHLCESRIQETNTKCNQKLAEQKKQTEETIERHVKFIEQLVKDKKELTECVDAAKVKLKEEEAKWGKKFKDLQQSNTVEMKKAKEAWMAAEKIRREKWEKEKTHEIKVNTTKALQPELVSLMQKHQTQLKEIEADLASKCKREKEALVEEYENKMKDLKEKYRKETELAVDKEREESDRKLREQYDKLQREFVASERKIRSEWEQECERLEGMRKADRVKHEKELSEMQKYCDSQKERTREFFEERCRSEVEKEKESLKSENEKWKQIMLEEKIEEAKAEMRKVMEEKRREEIEMVINKLSEETQGYKKQVATQHEAALKRLSQEKDKEIYKLKKDIEIWEQKYETIKKDKEMLDENLVVLINKLEANSKGETGLIKENEKLQKQLEESNADNKNKIRELEEKYKEIIFELEEDVKTQNENLLMIQQEREKEMNSVKEKNAQEMEEIETHVKKALIKKDEAIGLLREEVAGLKGQVAKYQELLQKQRKELLPYKGQLNIIMFENFEDIHTILLENYTWNNSKMLLTVSSLQSIRFCHFIQKSDSTQDRWSNITICGNILFIAQVSNVILNVAIVVLHKPSIQCYTNLNTNMQLVQYTFQINSSITHISQSCTTHNSSSFIILYYQNQTQSYSNSTRHLLLCAGLPHLPPAPSRLSSSSFSWPPVWPASNNFPQHSLYFLPQAPI